MMGDYYVGVDIGQKHDHSAIIALEKRTPSELYVVYKRRFRLGTEYSAVIGHLQQLYRNLDDVKEILIDQTGVGEVFVEEVRKSGIRRARGIMLTVPSKQEILVFLKKVIEEKRLHYPLDSDLINEITLERFELTKSGQIQYSHPTNTHDDVFWALGLAVYASRPDTPVYHPIVLGGHVSRPVSGFSMLLPKISRKPPISGEWPCCIICGQYRRVNDPVCPKCHGNPDKASLDPYVPEPWDTEHYLDFLEKHKQ